MTTTGRRAAPALVLALLVGAPRAAPAQTAPDAPSGLWWSVGVGAGSLHFECAICQGGRDMGPTVEGAIGAWASPRLRVGLGGSVWSHDDDGVRELAYRAGLVAHYYSSATRHGVREPADVPPPMRRGVSSIAERRYAD